MQISILDGYAGNPGDLSWDRLQELATCHIYDRTLPHQVVERAAGHEMLLTNKVAITAQHMDLLPQLRYIGVLSTGYNIVDVEAAHGRGIVVTNVPAYSTASVAQLAIAHLLNICCQVQHYTLEARQGVWSHSHDFSYTSTPVMELAGKTMGIVGLGKSAVPWHAWRWHWACVCRRSPAKGPMRCRQASRNAPPCMSC